MATINLSDKAFAKLASVSLQAVQEFCLHWDILELALFGSVLRDDFGPDSDVDVLVTFAAEVEWGLFDHAQMEKELSALFGRKVDLVSRRAVERSQNWIRRKSILNTAQAIYVN